MKFKIRAYTTTPTTRDQVRNDVLDLNRYNEKALGICIRSDVIFTATNSQPNYRSNDWEYQIELFDDHLSIAAANKNIDAYMQHAQNFLQRNISSFNHIDKIDKI